MQISRKKHLVLSALYNFRCLTSNQIYEYIFINLSRGTCSNLLSEMVKKDGLIEKIGYHNKSAYYRILPNGIRILRNFGVIPVCRNKQDSSQYIPVLPAAEIRLNDNNISHQLSLNQFVIDFINRYPELDFEYFDEKYISSIFSGIRPDGIIKTSGTLYFLEMDMNTEKRSRLMQKWESYRSFIHSQDFYLTCTGKIKVLFILENTGENSRRKYLLQQYIDTNLRSEISPKFNLYIDRSKNLFDTLDGFIDPPLFSIFDLFKNKGFDFEKIDNLGNYSFMGCIFNQNQKFIIDDYSDSNMYVYKKIISFSKINTLYNSAFGGGMKYLVVARDIHEAYELLKQTESYYDGLYFITMDRLRDFTFNSALFTIGRNGILYHFDDGDIRIKREENYVNAFF